VELEIIPEPTPEEREAIVRAIAAVPTSTPDGPALWWLAGVRESLENGEHDSSG
jgi:hypothetical protein